CSAARTARGKVSPSIVEAMNPGRAVAPDCRPLRRAGRYGCLLPAQRRVEPRRVGVVPDTLHAFNVAVGKSVITPIPVAKLRTAPIGIISDDTTRAVSCLRIAQHPGA